MLFTMILCIKLFMIAQVEVNSKDADNRNSGLIQQERVDRFWSLSLVHVTKNMEPCKTDYQHTHCGASSNLQLWDRRRIIHQRDAACQPITSL